MPKIFNLTYFLNFCGLAFQYFLLKLKLLHMHKVNSQSFESVAIDTNFFEFIHHHSLLEGIERNLQDIAICLILDGVNSFRNHRLMKVFEIAVDSQLYINVAHQVFFLLLFERNQDFFLENLFSNLVDEHRNILIDPLLRKVFNDLLPKAVAF